MSQAKAGDTIRFHYTGAFSDGRTFDSSRGREPLEVQLGAGHIIPGLDAAMTGMAEGESKKVTIPPEQGYGERDENRMQAVPREHLPEDLPTQPGTQLNMETPDGQTVRVIVVAADEETVTLDANHPLAGSELVFDVELVEIK